MNNLIDYKLGILFYFIKSYLNKVKNNINEIILY